MTYGCKEVMEHAENLARQEGAEMLDTSHILTAFFDEAHYRNVNSFAQIELGPIWQISRDFGLNGHKFATPTLSQPINAQQAKDNWLADGNWSAKRDQQAKDTEQEINTLLPQIGRDLTALARAGELDPVVGRDAEIALVIQTLLQYKKPNPILVGPAGVGKTAIVEGLAQMIAAGTVPERLRDSRIIEVDTTGLVAGTGMRGEFEERMKALLDLAEKNQKIILFIDEAHRLIGLGDRGTNDAANILKRAMGGSKIRVIGTTTHEEYRIIEEDTALSRRFNRIEVDEPSPEATFRIIQSVIGRYEMHHGVRIPGEAIQAAIEMSNRFMPYRKQPDKALTILDAAAAYLAKKRSTLPEALQKMADRFKGGKEAMTKGHATLHNLTEAEEEFRIAHERWLQENGIPDQISRIDIARVISMLTGIPAETISQDERDRLLKLEELLSQHIIGQQEAITAICNEVRLMRAALSERRAPPAFVFAGPTGVGKTELVRTLAKVLYGSEEALLRIDMSEYSYAHNVSRLFGSPPGYVGHEDGGQLTNFVKRRPSCIILLDEIEKAHPHVFDAFLQVLDNGVLTDGQGEQVYFREAIVIMTTNLGTSSAYAVEKGIGFIQSSSPGPRFNAEAVQSAVKDFFRPEFYNRLTKVVVFSPLTKEQIMDIAGLKLRTFAESAAKRGARLEFSDPVVAWVAERGYDPRYGARPLQRLIKAELEAPLAALVLANRISVENPATIKVGLDPKAGKLTFEMLRAQSVSVPQPVRSQVHMAIS